MGKLYDQMKVDLELKNLSPRTRSYYLSWMRSFALHFHRSPEEMGDQEIREYLHYLIQEKKASQSGVSQAYSALKFFYETTLKRNWNGYRIPRAQRGKRLPVVLSQPEIQVIFSAVGNLKHRTVLMTIYSAGLRLSEVVHLKVSDVDSQRMTIRVQQGKGQKDRYTLLAQRTLDILRDYWKEYRPSGWLFPGKPESEPRVVQGYNGQAVVDGKFQVIVHGEAFGEGQDHYHVGPRVEGARENLKSLGHPEDCLEGKVLVADSNYNSPVNLEVCEGEKLDAYIPDKDFRTRDPRFATQERWKFPRGKRLGLEDFQYREEQDEYICPKGKILCRIGNKSKAYGKMRRRYVADREACCQCDFRARCMAKKVRRRNLLVPLGGVPRNLLREMARKVDTERGREIYHQRIGVVEPVFANIRAVKRMDRFTLRGKIKVNTQWVLYCMVHNIGKIMSFGFA